MKIASRTFVGSQERENGEKRRHRMSPFFSHKSYSFKKLEAS